MSQVYSAAFKSTIDEIKKVVPQVSNAFIFERNMSFFAKDDKTSEESVRKFFECFSTITSKAECLEEFESFTIQGVDGQVNISCTNNFCFAAASSYEADEKILKTVTTVLVPTIIRLADQITQSGNIQDIKSDFKIASKLDSSDYPEVRNEPLQSIAQQSIEPEAQPIITSEVNEPILPEPPINQFMVEKISGLMVSADTVRIDKETIEGWINVCNGKDISNVIIEGLNGKKANCKFKPIKDQKYFGKGIIQIPEKIMDALELSKGELILVKPVIE